MAFYLGVAGSLSQSSAILAGEDGSFIAEHTNLVSGLHYREMSDPVLHFSLDHLIKSLGLKASEVLRESQEEIFSRLNRVVIAVAGLDQRFDSVLLVGTLRQILGDCKSDISIRSIGEACHCGAFLGDPGILVRLGVGCSIFGRDSEGNKHLSNAWGFLPGDLGAGYHIGQQVLHSLTRAADGRADAVEKGFALEVLSRVGEDSVPALFDQYRRDLQSGGYGTMTMISTLADPVLSLASEGHPLAGMILALAAKEVVDGICAVAAHIHLDSDVDIIFQGSLSDKQPSYVSRVLDLASERLPHIKFSKRVPRFNRTVGVGLLALEQPLSTAALQLSPACRRFLDTIDKRILLAQSNAPS